MTQAPLTTTDGIVVTHMMPVWLTPHVCVPMYQDHLGPVLVFPTGRRPLGAYDRDEKFYSTATAAQAALTPKEAP